MKSYFTHQLPSPSTIPKPASKLIAKLKRLTAGIVGVMAAGYGGSLWLAGKWHIGILVPLLIGLGLLAYAAGFWRLQRWLDQHPFGRRLWLGYWGLFWLWLGSVGGFFYYLSDMQRYQVANTTPKPVAAIIVLGSGYKDGKPTPTLEHRLQAAATLARKQPAAPIVLSGGKGMFEPLSEARVMADFLVKHEHISAHRLWLEEGSTSTELNLANSRQVLQQHGIDIAQPIAVVSSDFHLPRAKLIGKKQGYQQLVMVAAPTPPLGRYAVWLREYFAWVSGWLLAEY